LLDNSNYGTFLKVSQSPYCGLWENGWRVYTKGTKKGTKKETEKYEANKGPLGLCFSSFKQLLELMYMHQQ
jgi:hypothetical protein